MIQSSPVTKLDAPVGANVAEVFARHVEDHGATYFDQQQAPRVSLVHQRERQNSTLYWFEAAFQDCTRCVIVKVPYGRILAKQTKREGPPLPDVPRLFPKSSREVKCHFEYLALEQLQDQMTKREDPRFAAIRALDYLPQHYALLMEKAEDRSLRQLFLRVNRWQRLFAPFNLEPVFHNVGAWLRIYHHLPPLAHTRPRSDTRADYVSGVGMLTDYLSGYVANPARLRALRDRLAAVAEVILPERLALVLGHGDFAPRNVLVDSRQRVTVFDTQSKWQVPLFEDISRFLHSVKVSGPQMSSYGLLYSSAVLQRYEAAFLRGYFATAEIPLAAIRLFECQHILSMWTSINHHYQLSRGSRRIVKGCRLAVWGSYLLSTLQKYLGELETASRQAPAMGHVCGR